MDRPAFPHIMTEKGGYVNMDLDQQDKAMEEGFGRVSPAVGEHAIEECARLRTVLRETIVALRSWDGDPDVIQVIVAKCARALGGVIRP